jgi:hypothetical protein
VAHWIQFSYERNEYLVNLASIRFFARDSSQRISFWLPDSAMPVVLVPQDHPTAYRQVMEFIDRLPDANADCYWVSLVYDRREYTINLKTIRAFSRSANGRLVFWLPDNGQDMVLHPELNAEAYHLVNDYITKCITGPGAIDPLMGD